MGHFAMQASIARRRISRGSPVNLSNEKAQSNVHSRVFTTSVATQCKQWFCQTPLVWRHLYRLKYDEGGDSQKQSPRKRYFGSPRKRLDHFSATQSPRERFVYPACSGNSHHISEAFVCYKGCAMRLWNSQTPSTILMYNLLHHWVALTQIYIFFFCIICCLLSMMITS